MGVKARSRLFHGTSGAMKFKLDIQYFASKLFNKSGHTNYRRIADNRENFYDKNAQEISEVLEAKGYSTLIRKSSHSNSKANLVITTNYNKNRNITCIEVSSGSVRHGNIPYVRISTTDYGKFKVINGTKSQYKSDGHENSKLIFKRRKKNVQ